MFLFAPVAAVMPMFASGHWNSESYSGSAAAGKSAAASACSAAEHAAAGERRRHGQHCQCRAQA